MASYSSISTQCNLFHKEKSSKLVQINFVRHQKNKQVQCEPIVTNKYSQTVINSVLGGDQFVLCFNVRGKIIECFFYRFRRYLLCLRLSVNKSIFIVG